MQLHIVDGRLGKDAEVKADKNGRNYARFSLANRVFKNGDLKSRQPKCKSQSHCLLAM